MRQKKGSVFLLSITNFFVFVCFLSSCGSSKKINTDFIYFKNGADTIATPRKETVIQANDLLGIQVYSRTLNQEQAAIFNIPSTANSSNQGYQVNSFGNIEMPIIGAVKAMGLTKNQLQEELVQKLTNNVKNPSVIVKFLQFNINVLGEVRSPGTQKFNVDRVTIIDALSAAGDLTDFGKREDVTVIREENSKKISHTIDLRSKTLFESPVYVLQPNDIVYVGPNKTKLKNLTADPVAQRTTGLIFSIISLTLGIATLVITSLK